jgi:hypothetical protein
MMSSRRVRGWWLLALTVACERAKSPPASDSATIKPAGAADSMSAPRASTWNASAGPVLLVATDDPSRAFIVAPDSATTDATLAALPHPADVTLLSRAGTVQTAQLPDVNETGACAAASLTGAPPPHAWNIGFIGGVVAPLPIDSIESIPATDSSALVVWMNRLASALPNDSAGRFNGLPFVVRGLWRFTVPAGPRVVVGSLVRQINQEATPLQERTFLVAEQSPADSSYSTVYSERRYGDEETIQNTEVLAGALIGSNRAPTIVVARDYGDTNAFGFIERVDGRWRIRWTSARRHC